MPWLTWAQTPTLPAYLDYPSGVNLYFHTLNPFNGLWSLPIQLAGGLLLAYNSVVLFSFAVAGYGAYLLTRYVLRDAAPRSAWPAWVAGIIFAMSPFHFAHLLGHMQVFSLEWIPFYVLYLMKTLAPTGERSGARGKHARWRYAGLAALFLVLAGLCDWYFVLYLMIFTVLYLAYLLLCRRLSTRAVVALAGAGVMAGLALSPLWWPMVREARQSTYMVPNPEHAVRLSADLLAFVTPNEMHPLWGEAMRAWSERFTHDYIGTDGLRRVHPLAAGSCVLWCRRSGGDMRGSLCFGRRAW